MISDPACRLCALHKGRKTVCVPGRGSLPCDLMVVGSAPGLEEDRCSEPLSGPPGTMLKNVLGVLGSGLRVYTTNIVKCRPPCPKGQKAERDPKKAEIAACRRYWHEELRLASPKVILCLGPVAAYEVIAGYPGPKPEISMRENYSTWYWTQLPGKPPIRAMKLIPTRVIWHPNTVLGQPNLKPYFGRIMTEVVARCHVGGIK